MDRLDRMRVSITGTFGVLRENNNGRRVVEFRDELGLCGGNTYFECGKGPRWSGGKVHDRYGAGEEGYAVFCAGYEGSVKNGMRHLRSPC